MAAGQPGSINTLCSGRRWRHDDPIMAAVHYAVNWKASTEDGEGNENSAVTPSATCEQRFPVNGNAKQHAELKAGLGATTVHKAAVGQGG